MHQPTTWTPETIAGTVHAMGHLERRLQALVDSIAALSASLAQLRAK